MAQSYERQSPEELARVAKFGVACGSKAPASESGRYNRSEFPFNLRVAHFAVVLCLTAVSVTGCGGRRTVAARRTGPIQPDATITPPAAKGDSNANSASAHSNANPTGQPSDQPGEAFEEGKASWYGAPFHGRRASNGEVYDMNRLTAAHRTLPFNTVVRVTNMTN